MSARGRVELEGVEKTYLFGPFRLHVTARQLMLRDMQVTLHGRAFDMLVALVRRRGVLASKNDLLDEVWPGIAVEENNVTTQVLNLRKFFTAHDPDTSYIVTDAGRGYRFVAEVSVPEAAPPPGPEPEDSAPDVAPEAADASVPVPAREPHNLPSELNSFVGRSAELAEIAQRLHASAVLTLVGSGGVGKTRCAVRVGYTELANFADGVWLVELAHMNDGNLVAEAVCRVIGAPVSGERPAVEVAAAFLRQRHLLLIFDNCEHVLDEVARTAAALVKQCPGVKILATSRQALGIDGETVFRMPSLPLPPSDGKITAASAMESDAVRLFVDRADAAAGGYILTDADASAVVTICRRLDGVAMATELAAARLRMLKPAEIAARLEDVFRLLTGGNKAALPRQQTLRATIDWSFALLSTPEQILLRRLSVFVDGFSLEGATAVGAGGPIDAWDVLDLLQALVDKSLVNADRSGTITRYRMLETTRHYAREKLTDSGESGRFRRMADYLASFFARGEASWSVTPTDVWIAEFGPEVENLRAAIDWAFGQKRRPEDSGDEACDPALGIALVAASGSVAEEMSLLADMKRWTAAAMQHLSPATPKARAGWVLYWVTRHQSVFGVRSLSDCRRESIALFREAGDTIGLCCALRSAGIALMRPGENTGEALDMLTEAVLLARPLGRTKDLANALAQLGVFHFINGNEEAAQQLTEEAMSIRRVLRDQTGLLVSYINLAEFAFIRGDSQVAIAYSSEALATARQCRVQEVLATVLANLANYLLSTNDVAAGRQAAEESLAIYQALGLEDYAAACLEHIALACVLEGFSTTAARLFGFTDAFFRRTNQVRDRADQVKFDRLNAELERSFEPAKLQALITEGASWDWETAVAAALGGSYSAGRAVSLAIPTDA